MKYLRMLTDLKEKGVLMRRLHPACISVTADKARLDLGSFRLFPPTVNGLHQNSDESSTHKNLRFIRSVISIVLLSVL
jgi:hypothetical protein